jgi:hypothetical protein
MHTWAKALGRPTTLVMYPKRLPALQGIASLTMRAHKQDERLATWLETIVLRAEDPRWRGWAGLASSRQR